MTTMCDGWHCFYCSWIAAMCLRAPKEGGRMSQATDRNEFVVGGHTVEEFAERLEREWRA